MHATIEIRPSKPARGVLPSSAYSKEKIRLPRKDDHILTNQGRGRGKLFELSLDATFEVRVFVPVYTCSLLGRSLRSHLYLR
jgi:hypothetical protein